MRPPLSNPAQAVDATSARLRGRVGRTLVGEPSLALLQTPFFPGGTSSPELFASALSEVASSSAFDVGSDGLGGAGGPAIGATGRPTLGNATYAVGVSGAAPSAPAAVAFAVEAHLGGLLPLPLGGNCFLNVNPFIVSATGTDPAGNASVLAPIPNDPSIAGGHVYTQFAVLVGGNLQLSNALDTNVQQS